MAANHATSQPPKIKNYHKVVLFNPLWSSTFVAGLFVSSTISHFTLSNARNRNVIEFAKKKAVS